MLLQTQLQLSGNLLFRWRSYLPIFLLGLLVAAMRHYQYPGGTHELDFFWELLCLFVSYFGLAIRAYTVGHAPARTSGRNTETQIADVLNTTGAYSMLRNPLYLGNFFMGLGIFMFAFHIWILCVYVLFFWLYYERIILAEEAYLSEKFGDEYLRWADKTPVFFPNPTLYAPPALPFSLKTVLRREYSGFFAVIVVMFLLEVIGDMFINHTLWVPVEPWWLMLLAFGAMVWFTLRSLKKYTRILRVDGR
ncbi:MAG TPA: hypothetical protein ENN29_11145 [Candidatus Hydrogenedentes bacterium]|nr:hypothetical protein [Candidatus Hydrogenedentota bacterium]